MVLSDGYAMTDCGRKQTFDFVDFEQSERPVSGKADITVLDRNSLQSTGYLTSGLPPKAAVRVELA